MNEEGLALVLARMRIGIGAAAMIAPGVAAGALSGRRASGIEPLLARMLGARDVTLGLGTVLAIRRRSPARGWLEGSALSDSADVLSCLLARDEMRSRSFLATLMLGGASAAGSIILARRLDRSSTRSST